MAIKTIYLRPDDLLIIREVRYPHEHLTVTGWDNQLHPATTIIKFKNARKLEIDNPQVEVYGGRQCGKGRET